MIYYVSQAECTDREPTPGWYAVAEDGDGQETVSGPFASKHEALDEISGGAYSEYCADRTKSANYEQDLIDAGRGHLVRR